MRKRAVFLLLLVGVGAVCLVPSVAAQEVYSPTPDIPGEDRAEPKPTSLLSHSPIEVTIAVDRTPDDPESVSMTIDPEIPDEITYVKIGLPDAATVIDTGGFERSGGGYAWREGNIGGTSIEIELPDTATGDNVYERDDLGEKIFVADTDSWTLVDNPFKYGYIRYISPGTGDYLNGPMSGGIGKVEYNMQIEEYSSTDAGVAKQDYAFFGEFSKYSHEANDRNYELVVAEDASLGGSGPDAAPDSPEEIFEVLSDTTDDVNIGEENEEVTVYVMPSVGDTNTVNTVYDGVAFETETMLTEEAEKSVYVHEYIHLRQKYYRDDLAWLTEASATYYQQKLPLHQGWQTYDEYEEDINYGLEFNDAKLVEQDGSSANYYKGALAMQKIDRDIRESTNGLENLQSVLRELHENSGSVNLPDFYNAIEEVADEETAEQAESYIEGTDNLDASLSRREYNEAFGTDFEAGDEVADGSTDTQPDDGPQLQVDSEIYINDQSEPIDPQTETVINPRDEVTVVSEYENNGDEKISVESSVTVDERSEWTYIDVKSNGITTHEWNKYLRYQDETLSYTFGREAFEDVGGKTITVTIDEERRETFNITVQHTDKTAPVVPQIIVEQSEPMVGEEVSFSGAGSTIRKGEVDTFNWKIEGAGEASGMFVSHTFSDPGNYTVQLEVVTEQGNSYFSTERVSVEAADSKPSNEDSPQTPNGPNPAEKLVSAIEDLLA